MKKDLNAAYAGSFDPLTNGHLHIIERASNEFNSLTIIIADNPQKKSYFTLDERLNVLEKEAAKFKNVKIKIITNQYVAKYCEENNIQILVRGIRNQTDLDYENTIKKINNQISHNKVKTQFFSAPENLNHISSSLVKGLIGYPHWQENVETLVPSSVVSAIIRKQYQSISKSLLDILGDSPESAKWLNKLLTFLSEPHRYYHNLQHISELLINLDKLKHNFDLIEYDLLVLIIWFHDAVYNPLAKDNEEKSNELWIEFNKESFPKLKLTTDQINKVSEVILATKDHLNGYKDLKNRDNRILNYFLDLDLAILGSESVRFSEYDRQIRLEYKAVPDDLYEVERAKFLAKFGAIDLFKTEIIKKWFQDKAKGNLSKV